MTLGVTPTRSLTSCTKAPFSNFGLRLSPVSGIAVQSSLRANVMFNLSAPLFSLQHSGDCRGNGHADFRVGSVSGDSHSKIQGAVASRLDDRQGARKIMSEAPGDTL